MSKLTRQQPAPLWAALDIMRGTSDGDCSALTGDADQSMTADVKGCGCLSH